MPKIELPAPRPQLKELEILKLKPLSQAMQSGIERHEWWWADEKDWVSSRLTIRWQAVDKWTVYYKSNLGGPWQMGGSYETQAECLQGVVEALLGIHHDDTGESDGI